MNICFSVKKSAKVNQTALLGNYVRQMINKPTNRPTDGHEGSKGSHTFNTLSVHNE